VDWSDVLKAALSLFLVITAVGLGYLLYRMAGLFVSLARSVDRMTDETVPILSRAQITMDGVNQEIGRVDEIMVSAVHATKGTEAAVSSLARGISAPVRWGAGLVAGVEEAVETFRSRRAAERANRRAADFGPPSAEPPPAAEQPIRAAEPQTPADERATGEFQARGGEQAPPAGGRWAAERARREAAAVESARRAQEGVRR
jgi:hypothetical protein